MSTLLQYIILGFVQGFTEPLPISSSGHVEIAKGLMDIYNLDIGFSAILNFASMIVVVIYFRKKIISLIIGFFAFIFTKKEKHKKDFNYSLKVIVATIPLGIIGLFLVITKLDEYLTDNILLVGIGLLVTAIFLYAVSKKEGTKEVSDLSWWDVIVIGIFQGLAVIPGLSRSGTSLVGSLFRGLNAKEAFEFVFILYIPASIAALLPELGDLITYPPSQDLLVPYIAAFITTTIFTYISLVILKKLVISQKLIYFVIYLILVSGVIFIFLIK